MYFVDHMLDAYVTNEKLCPVFLGICLQFLQI